MCGAESKLTASLLWATGVLFPHRPIWNQLLIQIYVTQDKKEEVSSMCVLVRS